MPRYRNLTTDVLWVEHLQRAVKPDELIDVPDDDDRAWPEANWALVSKKTTKGEE